jgi:TonB-linked SusC/RagA family outer membrane protein
MMNAKQYASRLVDYNYEQFLYRWYAKKPTSPTDQGGKPVRPDVNDPNVVVPFLRSQDEVNNYRAGREINWIDEVTRVAPLQNYDLNISGASPRSTYYISGSYTNQKGLLVNDQFKRTILTAKVETKVTDWMTVGLNTSYSNRDQSGVATTLEYARNASPLASKTDTTGNYPVDFNGEFLMRHPLRNTLINDKDIRTNVFTTAYAKVLIPKIKGLTYDFNYSNNVITAVNNTFIPSTVFEGQATRGQASIENASDKSWIINNIVTYTGEFSADHRVNATLLYSREHREGSNSLSFAQQFQNQSLGYDNLSFGSFARVGSGAFDENTVAFMARGNYVFKNKYMITGTVRRDGYSGFGAAKKYATFPSLSVAWIASDEKFMKSTKNWLDVLKFRASYGLNGNQGIGRYSSLSRMGVNGYVFGNTPVIGIIPTTLGNSDLGWESTRSLNFGLDYAILNRRISGTLDFYTSNTQDVLVTRSLPGATGYVSVWTNIGKIDNKGVELELATVNLEGPLRWESRFVFALNRDKINTLYGDGKNDIGNSWFIGKPISAIYDYQREGGLWTEEELYKGVTHKNFYPGQFKLADLNNDGQILPGDDRKIVGYATPNYRFSISNNLSYKNFTLSFLVNSIQGGNGYFLQNNKLFLEATSDFDYAQRINLPAVRENWLPGNGVNNAPAVYNYPLVASGNYQDRSFVRLQDVSFVYNLGIKPLKALKLEGLQLYISGKNLYTWTKWEGYDPEIGGNTLPLTLPLMRSWVGGFRMNL